MQERNAHVLLEEDVRVVGEMEPLIEVDDAAGVGPLGLADCFGALAKKVIGDGLVDSFASSARRCQFRGLGVGHLLFKFQSCGLADVAGELYAPAKEGRFVRASTTDRLTPMVTLSRLTRNVRQLSWRQTEPIEPDDYRSDNTSRIAEKRRNSAKASSRARSGIRCATFTPRGAANTPNGAITIAAR